MHAVASLEALLRLFELGVDDVVREPGRPKPSLLTRAGRTIGAAPSPAACAFGRRRLVQQFGHLVAGLLQAFDRRLDLVRPFRFRSRA